MNTRIKRSLLALAVAAPAVGLTLWPAAAQPGSQPPTQPGHERSDRPDRPGRGERGPRSEWQEKYRDDLRDHPRLARAIVALHEARDYLDKSDNDLGGHKASSIKAIDDTLKELKEAMKFDPKRAPGEDRPGDRKDKDKGDKDKGDKGDHK